MTDQEPEARPARNGGDRRRTDRRRSDRRRDDRRAPPPPWRRPTAFVAYGVLATVILFALFGGEDETVPEFPEEGEAPVAARAARQAPRVPSGGGREAFTVADFESLVAEGEAAVGEVVEAELYCGSIMSMALREVEGIDPRLVALADADRRVPAAECRWSREARSSDFLLVVPPELATEFASGPEVELNFVRRRRVAADVLWLGRSDALALRTAGILTDVRGSAR